MVLDGGVSYHPYYCVPESSASAGVSTLLELGSFSASLCEPMVSSSSFRISPQTSRTSLPVSRAEAAISDRTRSSNSSNVVISRAVSSSLIFGRLQGLQQIEDQVSKEKRAFCLFGFGLDSAFELLDSSSRVCLLRALTDCVEGQYYITSR